MAVFKPDLSFTTIQDKQLKALESLNSICSKDFDINKSIYESVERIPGAILQSANLIIHGIDAIWNDKGFTDFANNMRDQSHTIEESILESTRASAQNNDDLIEALENIEDSLEDIPEPPSPEPPPDPTEKLEELIDVVKDFGKRLWVKGSEEADAYSELYNQTIRFIGLGEEEAQQFRKDIVGTVSDINSELGGIGGKLDPKESLATMLAISNNTNISNAKTLESLTRPILLAQETTNVNTSELAKLGARLYTRYNFSSTSLESLVDHIRNTSEGKDVSEDAMLQAAESVEQAAGVFYRGNQDAVDAMLTATTTAQAFYESNYIDSTQYIEDMNTILKGNAVETANALRKYGEYSDDIQRLVRSGDQESIEEAYELMLKSISERSIYQAGMFEGLTEEMIIAAQNWDINQGTTLAEFKNSIDEESSAIQRASDKYVSIEEQVYNKLSEATQYLATIQENLGVGMSDITLGVSVLGNVLSVLGGGSGKSILGALAGTGGSGAGGILGAVAGSGGTVAAVAAGIAVVAGTIYDAVKTIQEIETKLYEERESSLEQGINISEDSIDDMLGYMYQYTYEGGEKVWEQILVDKSEYTDEQGNVDYDQFKKDQDAMLEQYNQEMIKDARKSDGFWQGLLDVVTLGISKDIRGTAASVQANQNTRFSNIQDDSIGSDLWQLYWNNGLLADQDMQNYFAKNYEKVKELYSQGKILLTSGDEKGESVDASRLKYPGSFDVGTNYVTEDQLAYIHKGEAITPAKYNPANNMNELERLRADKESDFDMSEVLDILTEIRDYMQYWKTDEDKKEIVSRSKGINSQRVNLLRYSTLSY